jgi:hypothetical protein
MTDVKEASAVLVVPESVAGRVFVARYRAAS